MDTECELHLASWLVGWAICHCGFGGRGVSLKLDFLSNEFRA